MAKCFNNSEKRMVHNIYMSRYLRANGNRNAMRCRAIARNDGSEPIPCRLRYIVCGVWGDNAK